MAKKKMPENIWLINTKYIRADIAAGDSDEPLADGQYRWGRSKIKSSEKWEVVLMHHVPHLGGRFIVEGLLGGEKEDLDVYEIGPVIRPPEDQ